MNQTAYKSVLRFSLGTRAKIVVTKKRKKENGKPRESDTSPICRDAPTGAIGLNFGLLGHMADVIAHAKFCDNRFRGFGVLIPPILLFFIGIAGRPYNSVSTTVLHCDVLSKYYDVTCQTSSCDYDGRSRVMLLDRRDI